MLFLLKPAISGQKCDWKHESSKISSLIHKWETHGLTIIYENTYRANNMQGVRELHTHTHTHTDAEGRGCWYEWWWVVSRDGSSMSVQCVLRVFKWVKSQLWLPDGGRFDPDHSDRPGLWCAAAYYWHYRETGIFLPNHFQLLHIHSMRGPYQLATRYTYISTGRTDPR